MIATKIAAPMIDHSTGNGCPLMLTMKGSGSRVACDPGSRRSRRRTQSTSTRGARRGPAGDRLADRAADGRDDDEENESRNVYVMTSPCLAANVISAARSTAAEPDRRPVGHRSGRPMRGSLPPVEVHPDAAPDQVVALDVIGVVEEQTAFADEVHGCPLFDNGIPKCSSHAGVIVSLRVRSQNESPVPMKAPPPSTRSLRRRRRAPTPAPCRRR